MKNNFFKEKGLKKVKYTYGTSVQGSYISFGDKNNTLYGQYFGYDECGNLTHKGFCFCNAWVGEFIFKDNYFYYSFLNPGETITKEEFNIDYKKYLAKYRLGLNVPEGFLCTLIFLKDYE